MMMKLMNHFVVIIINFDFDDDVSFIPMLPGFDLKDWIMNHESMSNHHDWSQDTGYNL